MNSIPISSLHKISVIIYTLGMKSHQINIISFFVTFCSCFVLFHCRNITIFASIVNHMITEIAENTRMLKVIVPLNKTNPVRINTMIMITIIQSLNLLQNLESLIFLIVFFIFLLFYWCFCLLVVCYYIKFYIIVKCIFFEKL